MTLAEEVTARRRAAAERLRAAAERRRDEGLTLGDELEAACPKIPPDLSAPVPDLCPVCQHPVIVARGAVEYHEDEDGFFCPGSGGERRIYLVATTRGGVRCVAPGEPGPDRDRWPALLAAMRAVTTELLAGRAQDDARAAARAAIEAAGYEVVELGFAARALAGGSHG